MHPMTSNFSSSSPWVPFSGLQFSMMLFLLEVYASIFTIPFTTFSITSPDSRVAPQQISEFDQMLKEPSLPRGLCLIHNSTHKSIIFNLNFLLWFRIAHLYCSCKKTYSIRNGHFLT